MGIVQQEQIIEGSNEESQVIKEQWVDGGIQAFFEKPNDLACLLEPLVKSLDWKGTYRQLVESLPHFAKSLSLTEFLNVMVAINYNNEKITTRMNKVPQKYMPCLFISKKGKAVILLENKGDTLDIIESHDEGVEEIDASRMSGTMYRFFPFDKDKITQNKRPESFAQMFKRFRPLISQILILTFLYNMFIAVVPIYIMLIYDRVIPSESISMAFSFVAGILIFLFSAQLLSLARIKIIAYIGARMDKTIGESIIRHLVYLAPTYTESNTVGIQIARIKSFDNIRDFFTGNVALMACEFPFALIFVGIIFLLGGWLGFVPLVLALIFFIMYQIANPIIERFIKIQAALSMKKQTFLLETFARMDDIKKSGKTGFWDEKFNNMLVDLSKNSFDNAYYNSVLTSISEAFMQIAALAMIAIGAMMAIDEVLTLGIIIAIMMLTWKVLNPMKSFFSALPKIDQIATSAKQINKLFSIPTEITADRKAVVDPNEKSKIEFNRVTFRYRNELAPAILGVSFVIQPGELVCVSGKNSAGKSTLLKLILGLYKPQAGNVLINNMNIQQFDPIELRHTIAYMPQNSQIFYGTIRQNILFGNIVASDDDIINAAKLAGVHDEIMSLPEQYNTRLGDQRSMAYSATFIHLIMLARTYLRRASIILLDEPGNNFNDELEKKFLEVIDYKRKESTVLWVTHRPSHLKIADKILYLAGGEVALFGEAEKVLERLPGNLI